MAPLTDFTVICFNVIVARPGLPSRAANDTALNQDRPPAYCSAKTFQPIACLRAAGFVKPAIDPRNFLDPALPLAVLKVEHLVGRPVKVIGDVGYLLIDLIEGVA